MSKIWVDRIEAIARRRLARTAQVEALPPQPERLNTNLWHLNRRSWMHARYPGMMSRDTGPDLPVKQMLANDKIIQSSILEKFSEYTLEQLLIMPELPSEIQNAIREQVATYSGTDFTQQLTALYKPAGYTVESYLYIEPTYTGPTNGKLSRLGTPIVAPCVIREISWYMGIWGAPPGGVEQVLLAIDGYSQLHDWRGGGQDWPMGVGNTQRGVDRWVVGGALVPRIDIQWVPASLLQIYTAPYIRLLAEPLIRQ